MQRGGGGSGEGEGWGGGKMEENTGKDKGGREKKKSVWKETLKTSQCAGPCVSQAPLQVVGLEFKLWGELNMEKRGIQRGEKKKVFHTEKAGAVPNKANVPKRSLVPSALRRNYPHKHRWVQDLGAWAIRSHWKCAKPPFSSSLLNPSSLGCLPHLLDHFSLGVNFMVHDLKIESWTKGVFALLLECQLPPGECLLFREAQGHLHYCIASSVSRDMGLASCSLFPL